ncbi:MAG: glycerol-3-phosphate dehydrogenase/oxidase [Anaerolineaceae bacterium]
MFEAGWRKRQWSELDPLWDVIVIGGGITGAAVYRRSVSTGFKTLLVEANDFSFGTSSKSSKLVHGGFRYLKNRQFDVTRESVREREWLVKSSQGLVTPMSFVMPYSAHKVMKKAFGIGVVIYDLLAPKWQHSHLSLQKTRQVVPLLSSDWIKGSYRYYDAVVDDSRLVMRLIEETTSEGGVALNYSHVSGLLKDANGQVNGVSIEDISGQALGTANVHARVVINATGPWSDVLRSEVGASSRTRPLRGSHLVFSHKRLPIHSAVTLLHPKDRRAMFAIPWEGTTLVGTTDLDHTDNLETREPYCTQAEVDYILEAANATFPEVHLGKQDIISSFAGVRPIVRGDSTDPSKESRAHVVWDEHGLLTITGGKLTIFRIMAEDTLKVVSAKLEQPLKPLNQWFKPVHRDSKPNRIEAATWNYLLARYGDAIQPLLETANEEELLPIQPLANTLAELRYAARNTAVEHLDDLLLRRVRLGMLLPDGANEVLGTIKPIVQSELNWDERRWQEEVNRYRAIYDGAYSPQPTGN